MAKIGRYLAMFSICAILVFGIWDASASKYRGKWDATVPKPQSLESFDKQKALEDYDYLWQIIENDYPYLNTAQREYNLDVQGIKQKYRAKIENSKEIGIREFYQIVGEMISQFGYTGHFSLLSANSYLPMRQIVLGMFEDGLVNADHPAYAEFLDEKSGQTYEYIAKCQGISAQSSSLQKQTPTPGLKVIDENTIYMQIKSFMTGESNDVMMQKLLNFYAQNADKDNLIIDIRGNGGGNSYYWMAYIISPNIDEPAISTRKALIVDTPENMEIFAEQKELNSDMTEILALPNVVPEDIAKLDYWYEVSNGVPPMFEEKMFKGKMYLLVDENCYSAAEGLVHMFSDADLGTIVGTPTKGNACVGMSPVAKILPNSGLMFRLCLTYDLNTDGSNNVEFGSKPDYEIKKGEDALQVCLDLIREGKI